MSDEAGKLICAVCRARFQAENADVILLSPEAKWRTVPPAEAPMSALLGNDMGSTRVGELPGMRRYSSLCRECFGKGEEWFLWFIINDVRGLVWAYTSGSRDARREGKKLTAAETQEEERWELWGSLIEKHNQIKTAE